MFVGYHNYLKQTLKRKLNIWKFLMKVKEEAVLSEAKITQISIGCDLLKKKTKEMVNRDKLIATLLTRLLNNETTVPDFIHSLYTHTSM